MSWFPAEFHQRGLIGVRSGIFPRTGCQPFPPTNQPYTKGKKWNRIYILCAVILDGNSWKQPFGWVQDRRFHFKNFTQILKGFTFKISLGTKSRISNGTGSVSTKHWGRIGTTWGPYWISGLEKLQKSPMFRPKTIVYQKPLKSLVVCFAAFHLFFP